MKYDYKTLEEIDDAIDKWHEGDYNVTLPRFLGMSNIAYKSLVQQSSMYIQRQGLYAMCERLNHNYDPLALYENTQHLISSPSFSIVINLWGYHDEAQK